jgi:hypothetical protein
MLETVAMSSRSASLLSVATEVALRATGSLIARQKNGSSKEPKAKTNTRVCPLTLLPFAKSSTIYLSFRSTGVQLWTLDSNDNKEVCISWDDCTLT